MLSILVKDHHVQQMVGQGSFTDLLAEWSLAISKQYNLYRQRDPDLAKASRLPESQNMRDLAPLRGAEGGRARRQVRAQPRRGRL